MKFLNVLFVLLISPSLYAQDITEKDLIEFRKQTQTVDFQEKQESIVYHDIKTLSLKPNQLNVLGKEFTHVIKRGFPTDQEQSGRCWIFAGFNLVRYFTEEQMKVYHFEYSENYLFFYHKLELANYMLNEIGLTNQNLNSYNVAWLMRNGLGDGGYWDMFVALLQKYGAVPHEAMPETVHSSNTRQFNVLFENLVKRHVSELRNFKRLGYKDKQLLEMKKMAMKEIYKFLALTLGTPPEMFTYQIGNGDFETITTPMDFYRRYVKKIVDNKVHLMNDPSLKDYQLYVLSGVKNVSEYDVIPFLNVPQSALEYAVKMSVLNDQPVWFGADVGKYAEFEYGILDTGLFDYNGLFGMVFEGNKRQRLETYASAPTHAMVIFGVDIKNGNPYKWLVENSWGLSGDQQGYLIMSNDWLKEYVFDVIIDKRFLGTTGGMAIRKQDVIELPSWHHLWINPILR